MEIEDATARRQNLKAAVVGGVVATALALVLGFAISRLFFDAASAPTRGTLADAGHAAIGAAIGLAGGSYVAGRLASDVRRLLIGMCSGGLAYFCGVLPVFAATAQGTSIGGAYLAGLALSIPMLGPIAIGALAAAVLSKPTAGERNT